MFDVKGDLEFMEELISKYWQEKKYVEICDMAERVLDKSQKYYENREKYGDVNPFMIDKCCAYAEIRFCTDKQICQIKQ